MKKVVGIVTGCKVIESVLVTYYLCARMRPCLRPTYTLLTLINRRSTDESVPRPLGYVQAVGHILCQVVVTRHRGRGRPREVIVQHLSEPLVGGEVDIFQRLIETSDRPLVHLLVRPVAAVNPHDRGFIAPGLYFKDGQKKRVQTPTNLKDAMGYGRRLHAADPA